MTLRVGDLCAVPELGLALVGGASGADRVVEAAHVCELRRPGPWLQGGELLMTIGLLLPERGQERREYVRHLVDAGVAALALGLGADLPFQAAPASLVEAAEAEGLPLLTVPDAVPFIAVTKAVFAARAAQDRRDLERSVEVHRALTAAAASGQGLDAVLAAWRAVAGGTGTVVLDLLGRPLAGVGADPARVGREAVDLVHRLSGQGLRGVVKGTVDGREAEVHPLGAERLRGAAVLLGEVSPLLRRTVPALVSMLSLELERRHLADEPQRRARAQRLRRLLADGVTDEEAADLLAGSGVRAERVRGLAVAVRAADAPAVAADLALALRGGLVQARGDRVVAVAGEDVDLVAVAGRFARGLPVGIGSAVRPGAAARSVHQAVAALPASARLGRPAVAEEAGSLHLLLGLGDPGVVAGFADAVLAPVEAADPAGDLARTLRAWLAASCSWEDAAAVLGVHRHTVRNRVTRVERLTGRDLTSAAERHEVWLALQARDAVPG